MKKSTSPSTTATHTSPKINHNNRRHNTLSITSTCILSTNTIIQSSTPTTNRGRRRSRFSSTHRFRIINGNFLSSSKYKSRSPIILSSINNANLDANEQISDSKYRSRTSRPTLHSRSRSNVLTSRSNSRSSYRNHYAAITVITANKDESSRATVKTSEKQKKKYQIKPKIRSLTERIKDNPNKDSVNLLHDYLILYGSTPRKKIPELYNKCLDDVIVKPSTNEGTMSDVIRTKTLKHKKQVEKLKPKKLSAFLSTNLSTNTPIIIREPSPTLVTLTE